MTRPGITRRFNPAPMIALSWAAQLVTGQEPIQHLPPQQGPRVSRYPRLPVGGSHPSQALQNGRGQAGCRDQQRALVAERRGIHHGSPVDGPRRDEEARASARRQGKRGMAECMHE
jgi:hypothetical protein